MHAVLQEQAFLAVESIDLRMGTDGLSLRVQQSLGAALGSGKNKRAYLWTWRSNDLDNAGAILCA